MEEDVTFQCTGCWKVECFAAELSRLTDIVKGMEMIMAKEMDGRGRKEQSSDKKDEDRILRGGMESAKKRRKYNIKDGMQEGDRGESDSRGRGGGGNGRREEINSSERKKDERKKGSESRRIEREVNIITGMVTGRNDGREKGQRPGRCNTEELLRGSY